jgi:hypothetical protein
VARRRLVRVRALVKAPRAVLACECVTAAGSM